MLFDLLLILLFATPLFGTDGEAESPDLLDDAFKKELKELTFDKKGACWKGRIDRGPGRPVHSCNKENGKENADDGVCYEGTPRSCSDNEDLFEGLCYDKCPSDYETDGPVCWRPCPASTPVSQSAACCIKKEDCKSFLKEVMIGLSKAVHNAVDAGYKADESEVSERVVKAIDLVACDYTKL